MIATLVLIHGATIGYAANQTVLRVAMSQEFLYLPFAGFIISMIGLILALISGVAAWVNWGEVANEYDNAALHAIYSGEPYPKYDKLSTNKKIDRSSNSSMLSLGLSIFMIICTFVAVISNLP